MVLLTKNLIFKKDLYESIPYYTKNDPLKLLANICSIDEMVI